MRYNAKQPHVRVVGERVDTCPKCGGTRTWRVDNRSRKPWRRYCQTCINNKALRHIAKKNSERSPAEKKAHSIVSGARERAKARGLAFDLEEARIAEIIDWGFCEATGIGFGTYKERRMLSPSLDRIDPKKGYTHDNVRVVCMLYNCAKGTGTHEDVMLLVKALAGQLDRVEEPA